MSNPLVLETMRRLHGVVDGSRQRTCPDCGGKDIGPRQRVCSPCEREAHDAMVAVLLKWDAFMRANYKPEDISWWDEHVAALRDVVQK